MSYFDIESPSPWPWRATPAEDYVTWRHVVSLEALGNCLYHRYKLGQHRYDRQAQWVSLDQIRKYMHPSWKQFPSWHLNTCFKSHHQYFYYVDHQYTHAEAYWTWNAQSTQWLKSASSQLMLMQDDHLSYIVSFNPVDEGLVG